MSITKDSGRQSVLVAIQRFTFEDLEDGVAVEAIDLPAGAVRLRGELVIETAFNSATSDTIAVGDGASATAMLSATNVQATGKTALTGFEGEIQPTVEALTLTWDGTGTAPTAGAGYLLVEYGIENRATEVQP